MRPSSPIALQISRPISVEMYSCTMLMCAERNGVSRAGAMMMRKAPRRAHYCRVVMLGDGGELISAGTSEAPAHVRMWLPCMLLPQAKSWQRTATITRATQLAPELQSAQQDIRGADAGHDIA